MAGYDVERTSDAHNERYTQTVAVSGKKSLLAWRRHCDEQAVCIAVDDLVDHHTFFLRPEVAVSDPGNLYGRISLDDHVDGSIQNVGRRPKEERPVAAFATYLEY